jgi:hypothetical protein
VTDVPLQQVDVNVLLKEDGYVGEDRIQRVNGKFQPDQLAKCLITQATSNTEHEFAGRHGLLELGD